MNVVLMGPPGSGKGTQAKYFISKKSFHHISTGDLFRNALKNKTSLGQEVQKYLDAGELVPDSLTIDLVKEALENINLKTNLLFDGFPRNLEQAKALDSLLSQRNQKVDLVISLILDDKVVLERLTGRRLAPKSGRIYHIKNKPSKKEGFCDETGEALIIRKDDHEDVVKKRLEIFAKKDKILRDYYESQGVLKSLDADDSSDGVFLKILSFLEVKL